MNDCELGVNDLVIKTIAIELPHLRHLEIGFTGITEDSIYAISTSSSLTQNLQILNVEGNVDVSSESILALVSSTRALKSLNVSQCYLMQLELLASVKPNRLHIIIDEEEEEEDNDNDED
jgi:hypothetical protein